jgi:hypothetical protein
MGRCFAFALAVACLTPLFGGCSLLKKPDKANINLRKKNQELEARIAELQLKSQGDAAMIRSLQDRAGTLPTLPHDRLDKLFTTHDIKLGRLTGGADLDPDKPGQEGLRVYVTPVDEEGDPLKAGGSFRIEAFDVARDERGQIGDWTVDAAAAREHWSSVLNRYNYVLPLPWQTPPKGKELHLDVTFIDELTQGQFTKSIDVTVEPPPASSSAAATRPAN